LQKIENLHQQSFKNDEENAALEKEVSLIDQLIEQDIVRMDLSNKTLMDAIKISARNLFYRLFAPFKTAYDNYRDDHGYYRQLTQCDGVLRWTGREIEVHLVPQVNCPPKLRKIIEKHLADLNASGLTLPEAATVPYACASPARNKSAFASTMLAKLTQRPATPPRFWGVRFARPLHQSRSF